MHLLQIYKMFPFQEDLEDFMDEVIWPAWSGQEPPQRGERPLQNTLLAEPDMDPQMWLMALHLFVSFPDRTDPALLVRELNIEGPTAHRVLEKTRQALAASPDFYTRLSKSLGACMRCG